MKKLAAWTLALAMGLSLAGCGDKQETDPAVHETDTAVQSAPVECDFSFEGTVFTYQGTDYDLSERGLTEIMAVSPVGDVLMIEGELGEGNARYFLYDTVKGTIQEELMGGNMIWQEGNLDTAVYVFDNGIYRLDGTLLEQLELGEEEFIYDLTFTPEYDAVDVTVINMDGESRSLQIGL